MTYRVLAHVSHADKTFNMLSSPAYQLIRLALEDHTTRNEAPLVGRNFLNEI